MSSDMECPPSPSLAGSGYDTPQQRLRSARSVDVLQAASDILSQPYIPFPERKMSHSTMNTAWSDGASELGTLSMPAPVLRSQSSRQALLQPENEMPEEWREALSKSRITVWGGYAVALNEDTGEWKLIEKTRDFSGSSRPSTAGGHEKEAHSPSIMGTSTSSRPPAPPQSDGRLTPQDSSMSRAREVLFVVNVCLAQLLSLGALAQTISPVNIISNTMGVTDMGQMSWYTAAYGLSLGAIILPAGRMGDIFGHKRIFMIGWLWFAFWSLICGFSYRGGTNMLIGSRAMQGIGPALLVPNGIALIGRTFPMGLKRNISIACFGGCGPLGFVIGSSFSALCAEYGRWSWGFWAASITCALICVLSFFFVPADIKLRHTDPGAKWWEKYDLPGAVTGVTGLVLINFAFNQGPTVGWQESYVSFILVLGLISIAIFMYIELRVASHPLIPLKGLHREAAFTLACIACGWGSHGIWVYFFNTLVEDFRHLPALTAAAQTSPVAPIGFVCALAVPFVLRRGVKVAWVMFTAMAAFFVGTLLLATAPVKQTYWANTFLSIIIMPLGMNWSFPAGTMLMSNAVPREHQGIAASLVSTMVNYSISTGLGVAGTVDKYVSRAQGAEAGWRGALWFALALDALGLVVSGYFVWKSRTPR